jgi:hypothetical protein
MLASVALRSSSDMTDLSPAFIVDPIYANEKSLFRIDAIAAPDTFQQLARSPHRVTRCGPLTSRKFSPFPNAEAAGRREFEW